MSASKVKIGILGATGRMGREVAQIIDSEFSQELEVTQKVSQDDPIENLFSTDVIIDFSLPDGLMTLIQKLTEYSAKKPIIVSGTTGLKPDQVSLLSRFSEKSPVFYASNFSTGIAALSQILKTAAPLLDRLGYTPTIIEHHHQHKRDQPSGTAISLQRVIAPEGPGNIATHSVRAGEVIGDHEVQFFGEADRIHIGHYAQDRKIFARGAVLVARFLAKNRNHAESQKRVLDMEYFLRSLGE